MVISAEDKYMRRALALAQKGCGYVNPNPMVGAVIVKEGRIIGEGWHQYYGGLHAERNAIADCKESPDQAAIYVTLEPCCHYGQTPPCTTAIIESGITHVVTGSPDPNPLAAGKGIQLLRQHGIEVTEGVLREECDKLNEVFFHFIQNKTPYVVMKYAMTMDGKIATFSGKSKWITGESARRKVHEDRHRYSGIMTGSGTVIEDDPLLTCRLQEGKNPIRIICDSRLQIPLNSQIIKTAPQIKTIIATCCKDMVRRQLYQKEGCEVLRIPQKEGHIDLNALMGELGARDIDSILLEGGSSLNWGALKSGIVNKVQAYIAPKLFGGINARTAVGGNGVDEPGEAFRLTDPVITQYGNDILLESEVIACLRES